MHLDARSGRQGEEGKGGGGGSSEDVQWRAPAEGGEPVRPARQLDGNGPALTLSQPVVRHDRSDGDVADLDALGMSGVVRGCEDGRSGQSEERARTEQGAHRAGRGCGHRS